MFELVAVLVVGLVTGGITALKLIAPKTATKTDDEILKFAEKYAVPLEELLTFLSKK